MGIVLSIAIPVIVIAIVIPIIIIGAIFIMRRLCETDKIPLRFKFLCPGGILGGIFPGIDIDKPTESAKCDNPDFKAKNPDVCKKVDDSLYGVCVSDSRKEEIGTNQKDIDKEISLLQSKGVFLSKDGSKCLQCSGGYSRSLFFGEDSNKACTNATAPIKVADPAEKKLPDKNAWRIGNITFRQPICKNKFPATSKYETAQLRLGTRECWVCPKGYQKKFTGRFSKGKECKAMKSGGLFCGAGSFSGPKKEGKILSFFGKCYTCPEGFKENKLVTKATLLGGVAGLVARRALFFERGCVNRTIGTPEKPFKSATDYTPPESESTVESFGSFGPVPFF